VRLKGRDGTRLDYVAARSAHFRIEEELYERAQQAADADRRSLSNWFALIVERALEEKPREPADQSAT